MPEVVSSTAPDAAAGVEVVVCPDGPLLLRGDARLVDGDGREIPRTRRTVALCRCGATGSAPWCDGSHKLVRRAR